MDFGLARLNNSGDARLTKSGAVIGTPAYMPPEQIKGDVDAIGPGCDIYSLGVILFELLTGEIPFDGPIAAVLGQVLTQEPPPPSSFRPGLDLRLEAICLKMMAKQREDRYDSMYDVADVLGEFLFGTTRNASLISHSGPHTIPADASSTYKVANLNETTRRKARKPIPDRLAAASAIVQRWVRSMQNWAAPRKKMLGLMIAGLALFVVGCMFSYMLYGPADETPVVEGPPNKITDGIGMRLVLIPAGDFFMGEFAGQSVFSDEEPRHRVTVTKPFYMGMYEVTQKEYMEIMGTNPSKFEGDSRPVESVSWDDAREFCRKLGTKENVIYRLPTEAEWEYACRAGSTHSWHFGNDVDMLGDYAWSVKNAGGSTNRSEERRVGKECRSRWSPYH